MPISLEMYSLFWLHMTVHSKINTFGFVALLLNTCIELETILAINAQNGGLRDHESCKVRYSSLIMYKQCNTTSFVSNQFLNVSELDQYDW